MKCMTFMKKLKKKKKNMNKKEQEKQMQNITYAQPCAADEIIQQHISLDFEHKVKGKKRLKHCAVLLVDACKCLAG